MLSMAPARILIAEDEALLRLDLKESLEEMGYDVIAEASDGIEAVTLTRELLPDVAILDIKMPNLDGLEATQEIITNHLSAVVLLTAFSQRDLIDQACEAGALAYLVKPYQQKEIVPAIELAMFRFREHVLLAERVESLSEQLEARKVVDRAKGQLMDTHGLSEHAAFRFIQTTAMANRDTMASTAESVLQGILAPAD
jgi:AmiR/NasT family two-component response regulator